MANASRRTGIRRTRTSRLFRGPFFWALEKVRSGIRPRDEDRILRTDAKEDLALCLG